MLIEGTCRVVEDVGFNVAHRFEEILVGGERSGAGVKSIHAGEKLASLLKSLGFKLVIAPSFGRAFYRNAVDVGLPVLECPGIGAKVKDGDFLQVDLEAGTIKNKTGGGQIRGVEVPRLVVAILEQGGLDGYTKGRLAAGREG